MDEGRLSIALDRADRALARIERALAETHRAKEREEQLRAKVRDAVAELDEIIRMAEA